MMSHTYWEEPNPSSQMHQLTATTSKLFKSFGQSDIVSRRTVKIDARDKQTAGPNSGQNKTTFIFPREGFLDPQTVTLSFNISVTPDTATDPSANPTTSFTFLQYGINDLINRARLYINGGTDLENIEYYNRIRAMLRQHNDTAQYLQTSAAIMEGWGHVGDDWWSRASGLGGAADQTFETPIMFGTFFGDNYLPLQILPDVQIDLWWETFAQCFISTAPSGYTINFNTGSYTISNLKLNFDIVYFKSEAQKLIIDELQTDMGWKMHIQSWQSYSGTGYTTAAFDASFPVRLGSIKSAFFVAEPTTWRSSQYDYLMSSINSLQSVQFKVNNTLYPVEPMQEDVIVYKEFVKALGVFATMYRGGLVSSSTRTQLYNIPYVPATTSQPLQNYVWGSYYPYATIIAAYDFDLEHDENIISGLTTNTTASDIVVKVSRPTGVSTPLDAFLLCFCDKIITIKGTAAAAAIQVDS